MFFDRSDPSLASTVPVQLTRKIHRDVPDILSPEDPKNSAKNKIIVITGGGTGIGAATAKVWIRAGAKGVVIAGRRKEVLDKTAADLEILSKGTSKILAVVTDVTKKRDADNLFYQVKKTFGQAADVVLANAGAVGPLIKPHEYAMEQWWRMFETNVLGLHNVAVSFITSQPKPSEPIGTIISVNSMMSGLLYPGVSAYSISKLANQRYIEYLHLEYPTLRVFSLLPGIVPTDMSDPSFEPCAKDKPEQTGALALYLASSRADYLRGSLTSINWDIEEMEEHKDEIKKGLLQIAWIPVLPTCGGNGF
ncbi:NAD(P)-binding protein [Lojkania enalia]|uniref:NAD(P)-binding protein n=1 Tax=Lojkania enalia TaxID=147567 RepID=A0A9P4KHS0_9PLEO|nr:NAD(P)-binding protein [Didymosphaeria enalia]